MLITSPSHDLRVEIRRRDVSGQVAVGASGIERMDLEPVRDGRYA
jgi:hypothetical protein